MSTDRPAAPAIRTARAADLEGASAVLAEAFAEDPVMRDFLPAHGDRRARLALLFAALMRSGPLAAGTVDVAVDADGRILGAAVWEAPGGVPAHRLLLRAPLFLRALGIRGVLRAAGHLAAMHRARPGLPHWYLAEVGVGSAARGLGVGSALLAHGLARVDASSAPAYLESSTERNRALYRRAAFLELGLIPGLASSRPAAMWRPAGVAGA
ncbi:GNAT family N-acetyltransferase [Clavibacter michiganensis]|uniref:Acetyltransferase (GNAT) family protein n=1 Tax=Clavibacter michiganensis TaxID=28447 RepID=A0A251YGV7_9MICO|nr:GNAT family N-acetyltransferase [Clavibacter michiganensis]OUE23471.1 Acetyltransferase (GNAT) family protein [Clavibacter michiganensis]